jgi:choline dehydrogenase-like flavoprotein
MKNSTREHYDVVIVGAGVAGALMAEALTAAGRHVLLLEAGAATTNDPAGYQQYMDQFLAAPSGVPNAPFPANVNAPSANVLDIGQPSTSSYLVQQGAVPFLSDYTRAFGGTTLHWQGTCPRMVPNDFHMHTVYGRGVDWPIQYADLEPYYRKAEGAIGVSADVADQRFLGIDFPDDYVYPMHRMPASFVDQFFIRRLDGLTVTLQGREYPVQPHGLPQARNSTPNPAYNGGRGYQPVGFPGDDDQGRRCQGNSNCTPICPVQAKYNARKTLRQTQQRAGTALTIVSQAVASKLLIDSRTGRIKGVEYKKYANPAAPSFAGTAIATGRTYVVAANAIETAKLLLLSGAGNRSGQVGRNLMDHPYLYTWGLAPEPVYPYRGPDSTTGLETLRDGAFRSEHAAFRASLANWGWSGSPGADVAQFVSQGLFGPALRQKLWDTCTRQVRLGIMIEQLPDQANRVTVNPAYVDALGIPRPVVNYNIDAYSLDGAHAAKYVSDQVFARTGVTDCTEYKAKPGLQLLGRNGKTYNLMGAGHVVGTHRMGDSPDNSVVNSWLQTWDHPNLFLAGPGAMPTIGTANPTLTTAALTLRAADQVLKELR